MFRILSLDGGGVKGTFTAGVLAEWEKSTRAPLATHFDLITGTSTGSIIALALALGLEAEEILQFYKRSGPRIFPATGVLPRVSRLFRWILKPKYSKEVLRHELLSAFGQLRLRDSKVRLVIPTYDPLQGRIFMFKTGHHPRFQFDLDILVADVALASSAAPTFFAAARVDLHGQAYIDGGLWANCPALVGITEAVHFLGVSLQDIRVVSIGTTDAPETVKHLSGAGLAGWSTKVLGLMMNAQVEAAYKQAMLLIGRENFLRVNCLTSPGEYGLDSSQEIENLAALGRAEAVKKEVWDSVRRQFFEPGPAVPFAS